MRVSVLQENLAKGLGIVTKAITSRPSLPILNNVLLSAEEGRLKLSATNLELGIVARVGAKVDQEGAITLPAKTLQDLVNNLPPERVDMVLDAKTQTVKITCAGTSANIKGITAEEYPPVPEGDADTGIAIPADAFHEMIGHTVFAAAKEDNRPILTGISAKIDGSVIALAAADGYRLALRQTELDTPVDEPISLIIPAKTLAEVARIISSEDNMVYISIPPGRSQIMFHLNQVDVNSQLIDGTFPNIEQIIPKAHKTSTIVHTQELLRACKRAEIFARDANKTTRIRVKPGESTLVPGIITVTAQSQEKGDNEGRIDATVSGPELEIALNVDYLIQLLGTVKEDQIVMETNEHNSPCVLRPVNRNDFTHVIMPMSINR
jgi:DNA polymerase III subunit beta